MSNEYPYSCSHCNATFKRETTFIRHECDRMRRFKLVESAEGQRAWIFYNAWLTSMGRTCPAPETFVTSKYLATFVSFAKFVRRVKLPKPELFIKVMVRKNFPPMMWDDEEVYAIYLEYLDSELTPIQQATLSSTTIIQYCRKYEVDTSKVFSHMPVQVVIHLVEVRRLSPWLLLLSKSFQKAIADAASVEQRTILGSLIRVEVWRDRFAEHKDDVPAIKAIIETLGI